MAKRTKAVVQTGITVEQMETSFAEFAAADAKIQHITAKMDIEITKIREKYQDDLTAWNQKKEAAFDVMQTYAVEKREELFSKKKSMETVHGVLGFRTGTPAVKQLKGITIAATLKLAKMIMPDYVRVKEELDKASIINNRDVLGDKLADIGVFIDQTETFFVEPKKEEAVA